MALAIPLYAAVGFAIGTVAHELTHLLTALALPCRVAGVGIAPPRVVFTDATPRVDAAIRGSVWAGLVPFGVGLWWLTPWAAAPLAAWAAAVIGYVPRSPGDWAALRQCAPQRLLSRPTND